MLYGSMLGLLGTAVLGSLAASYFGLSSLQDLKPASDSHDGVLQRWLQPYKERLQVGLSKLYALSCLVAYGRPLSSRPNACLPAFCHCQGRCLCISGAHIRLQLGFMLLPRHTPDHQQLHSNRQKVAVPKYCQEGVWKPRFTSSQAQIASLRKGLHAATIPISANQTRVLTSEWLVYSSLCGLSFRQPCNLQFVCMCIL